MCTVHQKFPLTCFDSKFHRLQSMKLQLSYEIMFGYVQKLQIVLYLERHPNYGPCFYSLCTPTFRVRFVCMVVCTMICCVHIKHCLTEWISTMKPCLQSTHKQGPGVISGNYASNIVALISINTFCPACC